MAGRPHRLGQRDGDPEVRRKCGGALELLAGRPVEDRTLTLFSALIQNRDVRAALDTFTQGRPYGRSSITIDRLGLWAKCRRSRWTM
ncbi:MAG: hypothetical protein IPL62_20675 [Caulobacteraceae bacterium]|nr:hypothetical protein [Caulobacteraceae bacterium]